MGKFDAIFEPITIGQVEIKNRIAMAPMNMNFTDPNHYISRQQMAYYAARAKGGTGLIIMEAVGGSEHPTTDTYRKYNNAQLSNELFVPLMGDLVEHVHSFGARFFVQVSPGAGRQGTSEAGAVQPVAPSAIPYRTYPENAINSLDLLHMLRAGGYQGPIPETDDIDELISFANKVPGTHMNGETPREITTEEIEILVRDMGRTAKLAKRCGFDGLEIHAPHGYLLHQFLSSKSNRRTDDYGGSFENRFRFLKEIIHSCRKYVGPDYNVGVRISASDEVPEGFGPEYAKKIAKRCEEEGADFVHLSDGSYEKMNDFLPNTEGQVMPKSAIINEGLNIPLICPSVHNPENVVETLEKGYADMVSQGRQQIADPDWVNKVKEGKVDEIIKCTRCNQGCIGRFVLGLRGRCIKNPIVGHEEYIEEYMRRPILPIKNRVWQTLSQIGAQPSTPVEGVSPDDL